MSEKDESMTKYAVVLELEDNVKVAEELTVTALCPRCRTKLDSLDPPHCPNCGTLPFEKRK